MRVSLIIWSDPSLYINLIFIAQKLLKKKHKVTIFYRNNFKNSQNLKYFKFLKKVDLVKFESSHFKYLNKISFFFFIVKVLIYNFKKRSDLAIGFNFHGFLTSYLMNFFFRKTRIINYNFDFNYSDNSFSEKIQSYILRKIIKKAVISVTPSSNRSNLYKKKYYLKKKPLEIYNTFPKDFLKKKRLKIKKLKL